MMHTENMSITPSEIACLLGSRRRPCPERTKRPVVERGQELNTERAQIRTLMDRQSKFSPTVRRRSRDTSARLIMTEAVNKKLSETIESQQEELIRAQAEKLPKTRSTTSSCPNIADKLGITRSS